MGNVVKDTKNKMSSANSASFLEVVVEKVVGEIIEEVEETKDVLLGNGTALLGGDLVEEGLGEVMEKIEDVMPTYFGSISSYLWGNHKEVIIGMGSGVLMSLKAMSHLAVLKSPYTVFGGTILGGVAGYYHGTSQKDVESEL